MDDNVDAVLSQIRHVKCMKCVKCISLQSYQQKLIVYTALGSLLGSSFFIIFVGCELWPGGWWAAFSILPMLLSALPDFMWNRMCTSVNREDRDEYGGDRERGRKWLVQGFEDTIFVTAGFLMISTYWIPITLTINRIIHPNTLGMVVSGCFLVMLSYFIYLKLAYHKFKLTMYNNVKAFTADSSDDDTIFDVEREEM